MRCGAQIESEDGLAVLSGMLTHRRLKGTAKLLLGAMLFAQAALAAAECDWLRVAPAQALAAKASEPSCHQEPASNANLCLAHCLSGDQSSDSTQVTLPAMPASPVLLAPMPDKREAPAARLRHSLPRPAAPPPRILFQTFLI